MRASARPNEPSRETVSTLALDAVAPLRASDRVADAITEVRRSAQRNHIFYLYVVDDAERLVGIVSIRNLLLAKDDQFVSEIAAPNVVRLKQTDIVQDAYAAFAQSRFLSLPVVDAESRLKGVIHAHSLAPDFGGFRETLLENRTRNELFELLGIHAEDATRKPGQVAFRRLPWLLVNLSGGLLCGFLIEWFGGKLPNAVEYLALVPILLVVSESIGMQTASVVIGNLHRTSGRKLSPRFFLREGAIAFFLGSVCAVLLGVGLYLRSGSLPISACIMLTLTLGCLVVSFLAHAIPYLLHRWNLDPRVAAGPLVLSFSDCATLLLFLTLALLFGP